MMFVPKPSLGTSSGTPSHSCLVIGVLPTRAVFTVLHCIIANTIYLVDYLILGEEEMSRTIWTFEPVAGVERESSTQTQ
jgi:hypothetical protein